MCKLQISSECRHLREAHSLSFPNQYGMARNPGTTALMGPRPPTQPDPVLSVQMAMWTQSAAGGTEGGPAEPAPTHPRVGPPCVARRASAERCSVPWSRCWGSHPPPQPVPLWVSSRSPAPLSLLSACSNPRRLLSPWANSDA